MLTPHLAIAEFEDKLSEVTGDEKDFVPSPHASTHAEMVLCALFLCKCGRLI
jgi:hypothetical protein